MPHSDGWRAFRSPEVAKVAEMRAECWSHATSSHSRPGRALRCTGFLFGASAVQCPSLVVGTDIVKVADVADSIERYGARYTRRIFTDREISYCMGETPLAAERFAARFAAKEATCKLLRVETDVLIWHSIEVLRDPRGWCEIVLHGEAEALASVQGVTSIALSMSHEPEYATATVVAFRWIVAENR